MPKPLWEVILRMRHAISVQSANFPQRRMVRERYERTGAGHLEMNLSILFQCYWLLDFVFLDLDKSASNPIAVFII